MSAAEIVLCHPSSAARSALADRLRERLPYTIRPVATPSDALDAIEKRRTAAVVTVHDTGGYYDGLELLAEARAVAPDVLCVLYTDRSPRELPTEEGPDVVVEYVDSDTEGAGGLARILESGIPDGAHRAYPEPDDETERIAELERYDLDADGLQAALDRLSDLAASHFDAEYAYVSVIDDVEQRHLACHGLAPTEMDRENAICTYTLVEDDLLFIPDVEADPRFSERDYVGDLELGWYAGVPVRTDAGHALGTFCVLGSGERAFDDADRRDLERFAAEAMDQFELARFRAAADGP